MDPAWFKRPDWPMEWEIALRAALIGAIQEAGSNMAEEQVEFGALLLLHASEHGRDEARHRNLPASQAAVKQELVKLHESLSKAADLIHLLHRPEAAALFNEGFEPFTVAEQMRELAEGCRIAVGEAVAPQVVKGAKPKHEARAVTDMGATVFEWATGRKPSYTSSPATSEVTGPWPEFLAAVFEALGVKASVGAQVRGWRPKEVNSVRPGQ